MKLYHIDRTGHFLPNQIIELTNDFYNDETSNEYFKDGLSSHGIHFYLQDISDKDYAMDAIFEYERIINFPKKISRYQALFAFDINGVMAFIKKKDLNDNFYKIYEVEPEYYERHNMSLVRGWSHCTISKMAKLYWNDEVDPNDKRELVYEYLVKLPTKIGREVPYKEIKEEFEKNNQSKAENDEANK